MSTDPYVIVGASLAGVRAAESLRRGGYDGELVVIGAESHPPYDRPPLSKKVLDGSADSDEAVVAATDLPVADGLDITWRLGVTATRLDVAGRRITLSDGDTVGFAGAVVATGASPRFLPGFEGREGVHVVRTLDDGLALRRALGAQPKVVIIGAGFIGLEVAASCRSRGLDVTVLEPQAAPLAHALGFQLGEAIARMHRQAGVILRLGVTVRAPLGDGAVTGVVIDDDEVVDADVVIMGVGVAPTTGWLEGSGVDLDRGVVCDERLRVLAGGRPVPAMVAAGDVARWHDARSSTTLRIEHWTNAVDQGTAAARTLLEGEDAPPFGPVPYVWSDQLGIKLQLVGLPAPGDEIQVLEGSPGEGRWLAAYGRGGRLVAALGASRPAAVMRLRRKLDDGATFPIEDAATPATSPGP
ncbi:MAG: NAD(P)/FAD-dependent oxidoreductase [Actinomycetota bacterium]|nr:NAD(P)/FAD-dependent oxidoreductase [Actinomycetota bacterium]